jgi:very-short-patch-repair endonuclease
MPRSQRSNPNTKHNAIELRKEPTPAEEKLIIELDGSQHLDQQEYDQERTKYLESLEYKVIRFWNNDVMNDIESVVLTIIHILEDSEKI